MSTGLYQPQHATETNRTRHKADPRCTRELARRPGAGPEEQITSDLARKVAAHLAKYHGWAKVQRLEDGRKISRFYQPSARMVTAEPPAHTGYTREGVIAWLLTNGLEGVNPRVASKIYENAGQRRKNGRPA